MNSEKTRVYHWRFTLDNGREVFQFSAYEETEDDAMATFYLSFRTPVPRILKMEKQVGKDLFVTVWDVKEVK